MIYFDNAATTRVDEKVTNSMTKYLSDEFGNPTSKYYQKAEKAEEAVKNSRNKIAEYLNCKPEEIIFTSGATESNNFIIKGVADYYKNKGKHIITSKGEHKATLESCKFLKEKGFNITYLPLNENGSINITDLENNIREDTILITLIWANNELGSLNDISKISKIAHEKDIFLHVDATQIIGKKKIDLSKSYIDFLSLSGHKIYGPKGSGIAYIKSDDIGIRTKLTPLLHGGEQEYGLRPGTSPVHNIVGLGKAIEIADSNINNYYNHLRNLDEVLHEELKSKIPNFIFNNVQKDKIPGINNLQIPGIHNELFIKKFKDEFAISTGSACSVGKPSHVLNAIGLQDKEIRQSLRISFGKYNDAEEIKIFINAVNNYLSKL